MDQDCKHMVSRLVTKPGSDAPEWEHKPAWRHFDEDYEQCACCGALRYLGTIRYFSTLLRDPDA